LTKINAARVGRAQKYTSYGLKQLQAYEMLRQRVMPCGASAIR
jgi:hypothetical protein